MPIFDTLPFPPPPLSVSYSSSLLFSFKRSLQQAASNMSKRSNIYPYRIQLLFSIFTFLFRSHSSKTLENTFIIFYNNILSIINLSLCSFHTMLSMILPWAGREDGYKWHQSQAASSLGLPSDKQHLEENDAVALSVGIYNLYLPLF